MSGKSTASANKTKQQRARHLLAGGHGVARDDSDDELGLEDHPWQFIHARGPGGETGKIEGARMGNFECMLGDCVLLKAEGNKEAWVGLICDFSDRELEDYEGEVVTEKAAHFMWFSTDKEIRNNVKKKSDVLPNEIYITPSWDWNPLKTINGKATVLSPEVFASRYPSYRVPKSSRDYEKVFICRRGCNTRTATYTEDFTWEQLYRGPQDIQSLIELIKTQTKATRKRKWTKQEDDHHYDFIDDEDELTVPKTPSKRRKTSSANTPTTKSVTRTPHKLTTPTHKRIIIKRPLEFTPLGTRILSPSHTTASPFQIARTRLHVSSVPTALPCREEAFATVYSHLEAAISEGSGSCIYISGTPGTGKTATVREVIAQLNASAQAEELDDFIFVEINGMKVTDPHQSYSLLWEALRGDRISPSHALDLLEREFSHPNPRRVPCVVLMDELDQLVTKSQSVMYNFFNWPGLQHSRLIVLAVANTMDLPERTLSNKISSRLGLTRITFPGYTHDQLIKIIQSRLEGVPGNIVEPDAIQFASRKVAAVSGDARRALDICRRAVEMAETEDLGQDPLLATPSKKRVRDDDATPRPRRREGRVLISTIKRAIAEATSSPLQQHLKSLPLASKLFLAALLARTRRNGLAESVLGEVLDEAKRLGQTADEPAVRELLLMRPSLGPSGSDEQKKSARKAVAPRALAMGAAVVELTEAGIVGLEPRKGERTAKVRLNVAEDEIKLALKADPELRGLGFS